MSDHTETLTTQLQAAAGSLYPANIVPGRNDANTATEIPAAVANIPQESGYMQNLAITFVESSPTNGQPEIYDIFRNDIFFSENQKAQRAVLSLHLKP